MGLAVVHGPLGRWVKDDEVRVRAHLEPAFVRVEGAGRFTEGIAQRLSAFAGAALDFVAWHQELTAVTGNGRFASLRYEEVERDGALGLQVIAKEKNYGPPFMRFNIGINNTNQDVAVKVDWKIQPEGSPSTAGQLAQ